MPDDSVGVFEPVELEQAADALENVKPRALYEINEYWTEQAPLSKASQSGDRYLPNFLRDRFSVPPRIGKQWMADWLDSGVLIHDCYDGKSKRYGLRVADHVLKGEGAIAKIQAEHDAAVKRREDDIKAQAAFASDEGVTATTDERPRKPVTRINLPSMKPAPAADEVF
jgi:hypothetical protein